MPQAFGFVAGLVGFGTAGMLGGAVYGGWIAGAAFGSTIVGGIAAKLLTSVAISALAQALGPSTGQGGGITIATTLRGEQNPETILLGRTATAGQAICPPYSHGKSNKYLTHVIELCSAPGATLERLILGDDYVEIGTTPHPDYGLPVLGDFEDLVWIKYYDGHQTAADPMMLAMYGEHPDRPWTSDMVGAGICHAILTFRFHKEDQTQVPRYRFEMLGLPLYDLRRDSTAGGSGPQRWDNPATWTQTENPAVIAWNIKRGIRLPGGEIWGGRVAAADLPADTWIAAMNRCDEPKAKKGGGTEPAYRCGLEAALSTEPAGALEEVLKAASAQVADIGGTWKILVGAPALPVYSLTDDDVIVSEPQEYDPFPSLADTYNAVAAQYPDPESLWETKDAPLRTNAEWEAADAFGRRTADLSLPAVPYKRQVQRLMRAWIEDERRHRRHIISLPPDAALLEPLDTTDWSSARNGYDGKDFGISEVTEDVHTAIRKVSIRERDPADYDWHADFELPDTPTTPGTTYPAPETVSGFGVEAIILTDAEGRGRRVGLKLTWDADILARGLRWQIRRAGQAAIEVRGGTQDIDAGEHLHVEGVLPGTAYDVRARLISGRPTTWTDWLSVTTPALKLGSADLDWSDLEAEILDQLDALEAWIDSEVEGLTSSILAEAQARADAIAAQAAALADEAQARADGLAAESSARAADALLMADRYRDSASRIDALAAYVLDLNYEGYTAREELRRQISATVEGYAASFDERITVAASEAGAVAERVTVLEAGSVDLAARILEVDTARVDGEDALAQQIAAVSVGTNAQFDHVSIWYFDDDQEGWTGTPGNPAASGGYLRPASGAGSAVTSPGGLAVAAARYSQVRLRLRRVGAPVWAGGLWWAAAGQGWDEARRIALDEPVWDAGTGLVTANVGWSGTIDRIRLDLADTPDGANYIEADWIAIGRPSPGASSAEVIAERTARISADEAQASSITDLSARLTSAEGDLTATAAATSVLEGRVTATEGAITSQGLALTALESEVDDKASAEAVDQLTTRVEVTETAVETQAASVRAVRSAINPLASEILDQGFADFMAAMGVRQAIANAESTLNTRITQTDSALEILADAITRVEAELPGLGSSTALNALASRVSATEGQILTQSEALTSLQSQINGKASAAAVSSLATQVSEAQGALDVQSAAITSLESEVDGKASATALTALTTRVTVAEGEIQNQSDLIFDLGNSLDGKASASALTALTSRVTAAEGEIDSQSSAITSLENAVDGKASAAALTSLTSRVTAAEGDIDSQSSAIIALENALDGKASASALSSLSSRVTDAEGEIEAQAEALTLLDAAAGRYSASGLFRVSVEATPEGALSRIGIKASASAGEDDSRSAAIYLEATGGNASRVLIQADRFAIINGAEREVPFIVQGGVVYIKNALIQDAAIGTLQLAGNAVTVAEYASGPGSWLIDSQSVETEVITLTIDRTAGFRTRVGFSALIENPRSTGNASAVELRVYRGGALIATWVNLVQAIGDGLADARSYTFVDTNTGGGATTYSVRAIEAPHNSGNGRSGILRRPFIEAQQFKR